MLIPLLELNKGLLRLIAPLSVVIARSILAYTTILSVPDADTVLLRCGSKEIWLTSGALDAWFAPEVDSRWLPSRGYHLVATNSWLPSRGFQLVATNSWLPTRGYQLNNGMRFEPVCLQALASLLV